MPCHPLPLPHQEITTPPSTRYHIIQTFRDNLCGKYGENDGRAHPVSWTTFSSLPMLVWCLAYSVQALLLWFRHSAPLKRSQEAWRAKVSDSNLGVERKRYEKRFYPGGRDAPFDSSTWISKFVLLNMYYIHNLHILYFLSPIQSLTWKPDFPLNFRL